MAYSVRFIASYEVTTKGSVWGEGGSVPLAFGGPGTGRLDCDLSECMDLT